jgi:predicted nucleotidyltransferase
MDDYGEAIAALDAAGVKFVLVGGLALIAHGLDISTKDIDIAYSRDGANLLALASALRPFKPRLRGVPDDLPFVFDERTLKNTANMTLVTSIGDLDVLGHVSGVQDFEGLWERAVTLTLYGFPVKVAALDDLIVMKKAANRPKDQVHLLSLEALKGLTEGNA